MFHFIIEILLLVIALSIDSLAASFAYGMNRIRIPVTSMMILAGISGGALALSMVAGQFLRQIIPASFTVYLSFVILLALGMVKLFDRSCSGNADKADKNNDQLIAPAEAVSLGIALSLDSIAAGVGAGIAPAYMVVAIFAAFFMGIISILTGSNLGKIVSRHCPYNFCWISGVLLIVLAFMKLFQ